MWRWTWFGWILAVFTLANPVRAGVYNPAEPPFEVPLDPVYVGKFGLSLKIMASIAAPQVEFDSPLRRRYFFQEQLYDRLDPAKLSVEQKLHFSSVLIRRRRAGDAIGLLQPATRQHPQAFLLQSNLATAYDINGDRLRAVETMRDCLDTWPKDWNDLDPAQREFLTGIGWAPRPKERGPEEEPFVFFREADTYYLKLLRLRSREPKGAAFEAVDALFGDDKGPVKFVNEAGVFEPGKIAKAERARLPRNARKIVQQLLAWQPNDLRLQWLLGEILNANGDVNDIKAARSIFDELVYTRDVRAKEVMARRIKLNEWKEPPTTASADNPFGGGKDNPPPSPATDWRGLLIAFAAGLLVAVFGYWQIREIRRRRQQA
ncbi:MAG: hypothetical protein L0Y71_04390 [Gemmataceae bacterium]|nr:hypothetical protein [Gemmataceae bacterium]